MHKVVGAILDWSRHKPYLSDDIKDSDFIREYRERWCEAHTRKQDQLDETCSRYKNLLIHIFGSVEAPSCVTEMMSGCMRIEDTSLIFDPLKVSPNAINEALREALRTTIEVWRATTTVECVVLIFSEFTNSDVLRLMRAASVRDIRAGLDIWATLPCRVKRICVHKPRNLFGWTPAVTIARTLLSRKMWSRLEFVDAS